MCGYFAKRIRVHLIETRTLDDTHSRLQLNESVNVPDFIANIFKVSVELIEQFAQSETIMENRIYSGLIDTAISPDLSKGPE